MAYNGKTLLDLIPADVVSSLVLAAAAEALIRHKVTAGKDLRALLPSAAGGCGIDMHKKGDGGNECLNVEVAATNGHQHHHQQLKKQSEEQEEEQQQQPSDLELIIHPLEERQSSKQQQQKEQQQPSKGVQPSVWGLHHQLQLVKHCNTAQQPEAKEADVSLHITCPHLQQQQQSICTIYHAASSCTHPLPTHQALSFMQQFYRHNTTPVHLPLPWPSRTPRVSERHKPRWWLVRLAKGVAWGKLQLVCLVLQLSGRGRQAGALRKGFSAWCIQNSARYNRSLLFSAANAR